VNRDKSLRSLRELLALVARAHEALLHRQVEVAHLTLTELEQALVAHIDRLDPIDEEARRLAGPAKGFERLELRALLGRIAHAFANGRLREATQGLRDLGSALECQSAHEHDLSMAGPWFRPSQR
jgi:hypothetical protein